MADCLSFLSPSFLPLTLPFFLPVPPICRFETQLAVVDCPKNSSLALDFQPVCNSRLILGIGLCGLLGAVESPLGRAAVHGSLSPHTCDCVAHMPVRSPMLSAFLTSFCRIYGTVSFVLERRQAFRGGYTLIFGWRGRSASPFSGEIPFSGFLGLTGSVLFPPSFPGGQTEIGGLKDVCPTFSRQVDRCSSGVIHFPLLLASSHHVAPSPLPHRL